MYSIYDYGAMIADKGRMEPYVAALRDAVDNDSVVMDIGTGTGIFALLACHFGARHVYAIEPNDAIQVARESAKANGFSEKITFIQGLSTKITLPERADIIISDMRGALPLCSQNLPSIIDARQRHLAKTGILIPSQDIIRVALVEAPKLYQRHAALWDSDEFGINIQAAKRRVKNSLWTDTVNTEGNESIAGEPRTLIALDYQSLDSPNITSEVKWKIEKDATVHGIRVWFDTELAEGVGFSNALDQANLIYGSAFCPLLEPVLLNQGDVISIIIQANLVGDDYVWRWDTKVFKKNNFDKVRVEYKQSSFDGVPLSLTQLQKRASSFKPDLNEDGLCDLAIMKLMQQGLMLEDIAQKITESFPEQYQDWRKALARVGEMSIRYSK